VLTPAAAADLIARDARNADVVRPYLNGEDLNSRPDCSPSRCVIDFRDWPIERAREYAEPFEIVERLVRPERARLTEVRTRDKWWQFTRARPELYRTIAPLERVLVLARVSKTMLPALVPSDRVFHEKVVVIARSDAASFGLLTSGFHWWWAIVGGTTLRSDAMYTPERKFETFPQPRLPPAVADAGKRVDEHRRALMLSRQEGLTSTYNRVHDPAESAADIARLRELHVALDHAVRDAYGWTDLELGHDFHATRQGTRYTFEPIVRQEILDHLLELNHVRRAAEEAAGLHAKKKPARKPVATPSAAQATIFDGG